MSDDGHAPSAAGLHPVAGLGLLRPEQHAFTAMLDGWPGTAGWCLPQSRRGSGAVAAFTAHTPTRQGGHKYPGVTL